ncbi:MAG: YciI family protein [Acidimicrobiales bacterium]
MRFMLLQNYGPVESGMGPMFEWSQSDIQAHIDFQIALNSELSALGELVDAQGLSGPEDARFVTSDGRQPPVVSDGPFPETKELVAGYRLVEVASLDRAIEIAARMSAAPGVGGAPIRQPIEVREVLAAPESL